MNGLFKIEGAPAFFLKPLTRRFSLLPPVVYAGFLDGKNHRVLRTFETCSFSFILSGCGTYLFRGRTIRVEAPCTLLQWPGEPMNYGPDKTWDETFLTYPGAWLDRFSASGLLDIEVPVRPIPDPEGVKRLVERLYQELQQDAFDADRIDALCYELLLSSRTTMPLNSSVKPPRIVELEHILSSDLGTSVNFASLADRFGFSLSSMRRYWSRYHGNETFSDFRDACFRSRACRMLVETNRPVCEIASVLGFSDPYYFSRKFRHVVGLKPTEYRRHNELQS